MVYWTLVFFILSLIAGLLAFGVIETGFGMYAKALFVLCLVLCLVSLVAGRRAAA